MAALSATASADVEADVERVWAVVADVEAWPQWQATLSELTVRGRDGEGRPALCEVVFDARVQTIRTTQRVSYDAPGALAFTQERGSLKSLRGSWRLEDLGDGRTRASYALDVVPGGMLGVLVTGSVQARLRELLVERPPAELKARVEGA